MKLCIVSILILFILTSRISSALFAFDINAALICAQLECLPQFLEQKRILATAYKAFFESQDITFKWEQEGTRANFWLNTLLLKDADEKIAFLEATNKNAVMTRPIWDLMTSLPMYQNTLGLSISNAEYLAGRIVNIPSSVII